MLEFNRTKSEYAPTCPYCNQSDENWNYDPCEHDENYIETCFSCKEKYKVNLDVRVICNSTPDCSLNNKQHNFVPSTLQHYLNCTICGQSQRKDPE